MGLPYSNATAVIVGINGATNGFYQILPAPLGSATSIRFYLEKMDDGSVLIFPPSPPGWEDAALSQNATYLGLVGGYDENAGPWTIPAGAIVLVTGNAVPSAYTGVYLVGKDTAPYEADLGISHCELFLYRLTMQHTEPGLDLLIEPLLSGDLNEVVFFDNPATVWTFANPFIADAKRPSITTLDTANEVIIGDVVFLNGDATIMITFTQAVAGRALCN